MRLFVLLWWMALLGGGLTPAAAEVVRIVIDRREDVLRGRSFGSIGPYEKLVGRVFFAFDPQSPMNARITDIGKAPRNRQGRVEAWADFMILRPRFPPRTGRIALLEVVQRGGKEALRFFNGGAPSQDPVDPEHFGDGLLMRMGLTVIWVGWQHDAPPRPGLMRLHTPIATEDGEPIYGLARSDWTIDFTSTTLFLGDRGHRAYPVADPEHPENELTVRHSPLALRHPIPRNSWRFAREEGGRVVPDSTSIYMQSGFEAGNIYELVYRVKDPPVAGLGLAAVRDMMASAKHDSTSVFQVEYGIGFGIAQAGRFLRHLLYEGFNTDERGRKAFDGLMIHAAGAGRGSFNHRFAQPSREANRFSSFFYPTDLFPFTSRSQTDSVTRMTDGMFQHQLDPAHLPKLLYTNTGYDYWGRAASLIHTTIEGKEDIELFSNERIYHLASAQQIASRRFPPSLAEREPTGPSYRGNPLDFLPTMRALLVHMASWVKDRALPPPSAYPRIERGTLMSVQDVEFPVLPGGERPTVAYQAHRVDYGPRWNQGIIDSQPPLVGEPFPSLVPQVDEYGNERGGVPSVEILAPLGTYAPWNLTREFVGTYIPLSRTEEERQANADPRPSIEALYSNKADYLRLAGDAAQSLIENGWLLPEDVERVLHRAERHWDWLVRD